MQLVKELKNLLKEKHYSIANAAKAMDISSTTLHLWMNDKYKGNTQKVEDSVKHFLEIEKLREGKVRLGFVNTTIVEDVFDIAKTCHVENEIGVSYKYIPEYAHTWDLWEKEIYEVFKYFKELGFIG